MRESAKARKGNHRTAGRGARTSGGQSRRERSSAPSPGLRRLRWLVVVSVVGLAVALVALYAAWGLLPLGAGSDRAASPPLVVQPDGSMVTAAPGTLGGAAATSVWNARQVSVRDASSKGPADAPALIIEYSDFQCGYCRKFFYDTEPQIFANYVATGQARFAYKHLAILGDESVWAAQAAECAADQGRFWEYHDDLFRRAEQVGVKNIGAFTKALLLTYAQDLGLDLGRFTPCLQNDETLARVVADTQEARRLGFGATPSFLINNEVLIGAQPYAEFVRVLDRLAGQ